MENILNRVRDFIIQNNLISQNDIVGCALSGGADSVFMTYALSSLSKDMGFKIIGIHVNHTLRGEDSYRDEDFSKKFCESIGIECMIYREDILSYSRKNKISIEMGGREVRYKIFESLKLDGVITKCALGHHADDDVETIIMRIFKGTGLKGIEGISTVRDDFYIRPILFLRKNLEIERFLSHNSIEFITDESNFSQEYLRNKIRLSLIPYLNQKFSMDVTGSILGLKEICKYDNDFFEKIVEDHICRYAKISKDRVELSKECMSIHKSILYRIIRSIIMKLNGEINNVGLKHIKYICSVSNKEIGKLVQVKKNLFCINEEERLVFTKDFNIYKFEREICFYEIMNRDDILNFKNGSVNKLHKEIEFIDRKISVTITSEKNLKGINFNSENFKYFSLDNVRYSIVIRNRKYGDVFIPFGMSMKKKLKDFLINEKVKNKNEVPLICFDDDIAWVFGCRNSDNYKILKDTRFIVKIELKYI